MRRFKKNLNLFYVIALAMLCIAIGSVKAQAADITLESGKWAKGILTTQSQEAYYRINIKKTGYIKIDFVRENKDAFINYEIYNAKKALLKSLDASPAYIAVKKGIYYVRIDDSLEVDEEADDLENAENAVENYKIKYTFTAMKNKKNPTNVKNAPLLKKNQQVSGLVFSSKNLKNIIYKIKLTKETKVKFKYEVMTDEKLGLWLRIGDKNRRWLSVNSKGKAVRDDDSAIMWDGKGSDFVIFPKGTYYFVIQAFPDCSGYYKLKLSW